MIMLEEGEDAQCSYCGKWIMATSNMKLWLSLSETRGGKRTLLIISAVGLANTYRQKRIMHTGRRGGFST